MMGMRATCTAGFLHEDPAVHVRSYYRKEFAMSESEELKREAEAKEQEAKEMRREAEARVEEEEAKAGGEESGLIG
jgi:hypothetical protein